MTAFPTVQGKCPACGGTSLFLGSGGYLTCARIDCPNPSAASDLLDRADRAAAVQTLRSADVSPHETDGIDAAIDILTGTRPAQQPKRNSNARRKQS